eukprot:6200144-Pleurochrysis_carterae.AAC.4
MKRKTWGTTTMTSAAYSARQSMKAEAQESTQQGMEKRMWQNSPHDSLRRAVHTCKRWSSLQRRDGAQASLECTRAQSSFCAVRRRRHGSDVDGGAGSSTGNALQCAA